MKRETGIQLLLRSANRISYKQEMNQSVLDPETSGIEYSHTMAKSSRERQRQGNRSVRDKHRKGDNRMVPDMSRDEGRGWQNAVSGKVKNGGKMSRCEMDRDGGTWNMRWDA